MGGGHQVADCDVLAQRSLRIGEGALQRHLDAGGGSSQLTSGSFTTSAVSAITSSAAGTTANAIDGSATAPIAPATPTHRLPPGSSGSAAVAAMVTVTPSCGSQAAAALPIPANEPASAA